MTLSSPHHHHIHPHHQHLPERPRAGVAAIDGMIMSRIPVHSSRTNGDRAVQLSRLEQLKLDFQAKLALQKQRRLIEIYHQQQQQLQQQLHKRATRNGYHKTSVQNGASNGGSNGNGVWAARTNGYNSKRMLGRDRAHPLSPMTLNHKANSKQQHMEETLNSTYTKSKQRAFNKKKPLTGIHNRSNSLPREGADDVTHQHQPTDRKGKQGRSLSRSNSLNSLTARSHLPPVSTQRSNSAKTTARPQNGGMSGMAPTPPPYPKRAAGFREWKKQQDLERQQRLDRHKHHKHQNEDIDQTLAPLDQNDSDDAENDRPDVEVEIMSTRDFEAEVQKKEEQLRRLLEKNQQELEEQEERREAEEQEARKKQQHEAALRRQKLQALHRRRSRDSSSDDDQDSSDEGQGQPVYAPTPPAQPANPHNTRRPHPAAHGRGGGGRRLSNDDDERIPALAAPSVPPKPAPYAADPQASDATAAAYLQQMQDHPDADYQQITLIPCGKCGRKFGEDKLARHEKACIGGGVGKKRKVFDTTKMRTQGTEQAQFVNHAQRSKARQQEPPQKKKNNWRSKHENFIQTIRYARMAKQAESSGVGVASLPPAPMTDNPDYVSCPHCGRSFNESAAERHIPRCQKLGTKPAATRAPAPGRAGNKRR